MMMMEDKFNNAMIALDLSRNGAALLLGVTDTTIGRWSSGQQAVPQWALMLLTLMVKHGISPVQATRAIGLRHKDSDFVDGRSWGRKFAKDSSPIGRAREP